MNIHRVPGAPPFFPKEPTADNDAGLVAVGGTLGPEILIESYRKGVFPWTGEEPIPWYCPDPRMVLFPGEIHVARSQRQWMRRHESLDYRVVWDENFSEIVEACAQVTRPGQEGTWIKPNMVRAYGELHQMGVAHSISLVGSDQTLWGGLYGIAIGKAFYGESMFATRSNASKAALVYLCHRLAAAGFIFVDCQQVTEHLHRMGAVPVSASDFRILLNRAIPAEGHGSAWPSAGA